VNDQEVEEVVQQAIVSKPKQQLKRQLEEAEDLPAEAEELPEEEEELAPPPPPLVVKPALKKAAPRQTTLPMDDPLDGRLLLECEVELEEALKAEPKEEVRAAARARADQKDVDEARKWVKAQTTTAGAILRLKIDNLVMARIIRRLQRSIKSSKTGVGKDTIWVDKGLTYCANKVDQAHSNWNSFKKLNQGTKEAPGPVKFPLMPWDEGYVKPQASAKVSESGI